MAAITVRALFCAHQLITNVQIRCKRMRSECLSLGGRMLIASHNGTLTFPVELNKPALAQKQLKQTHRNKLANRCTSGCMSTGGLAKRLSCKTDCTNGSPCTLRITSSLLDVRFRTARRVASFVRWLAETGLHHNQMRSLTRTVVHVRHGDVIVVGRSSLVTRVQTRTDDLYGELLYACPQPSTDRQLLQ